MSRGPEQKALVCSRGCESLYNDRIEVWFGGYREVLDFHRTDTVIFF